MKLWVVYRRAPLAAGDRKVYVWRTVVMAADADTAISMAKGTIDASTPEGAAFARQYLSGVWSAREIEPPCTFELGCYSEEPTTEELDERAIRQKAERYMRRQQAR